VPFFANGQLLAYTDFAAPNSRIVGIELDDPDPTHWRDIVPQSDYRIQQFGVAGDRVFVTRVDRFSTQVEGFGIKDGERKRCSFFFARYYRTLESHESNRSFVLQLQQQWLNRRWSIAIARERKSLTCGRRRTSPLILPSSLSKRPAIHRKTVLLFRFFSPPGKIYYSRGRCQPFSLVTVGLGAVSRLVSQPLQPS